MSEECHEDSAQRTKKTELETFVDLCVLPKSTTGVAAPE